MIKHIVMWKLKDFANGKEKIENAKIMKIILEELKYKISGIKHIEVGINVNPSKQAYDVVLYSEFESVEDLTIYQNHSEHIAVSEFISEVRTERVVIDYEIEI